MNKTVALSSLTVTNLLPLASVTATAAGAGLDILPYGNAALAVFTNAAPSAGTNPTLAVKLQTAQDTNTVTEVTYAGTGTGSIQVECGPDPVAEDITFTASSATSFAVAGVTTGAIGTLTVGTPFVSAQVHALILAGAEAFVSTDVFTVTTAAREWVDVVSFTTLGASATSQSKVLQLDKLGRFLRAHKTIGGTVNPAYTCTLQLLASV